MPGSERVIFGFRPFGEPRKPAALTERANTIPTPGQDFMGIALMPDIPDHPVIGRIKQVMDRNGQFDHTKTGTKMPACDRYRINQLFSQLILRGETKN